MENRWPMWLVRVSLPSNMPTELTKSKLKKKKKGFWRGKKKELLNKQKKKEKEKGITGVPGRKQRCLLEERRKAGNYENRGATGSLAMPT